MSSVEITSKNKSTHPFKSIYTLQVRVYPYQGMTYYELLAMAQDRAEELVEGLVDSQKLFEHFRGVHDQPVNSHKGDYFEFTFTNEKL